MANVTLTLEEYQDILDRLDDLEDKLESGNSNLEEDELENEETPTSLLWVKRSNALMFNFLFAFIIPNKL